MTRIVPYLCAGYVVLAWLGGLAALARYRKLLDAEVVRFAEHHGLSLDAGHRLAGLWRGRPVEVYPGRVSVASQSEGGTAWLPATHVVLECDAAHRFAVVERKRDFVDPVPALDSPVASSDPEFDARYRLQVEGDGQVPFADEPPVLAALQAQDLLFAEAGGGKLRAVFRSDRLHDERLGSFAHLTGALGAAQGMAEPRAARDRAGQPVAPEGDEPTFPRSIYAFGLGLLGGFAAMVTAGEVLDLGKAAPTRAARELETMGLQADWHVFVAGFVVTHAVGLLLVIAGQALWRATRRPATPADAATTERQGPYR